MSSIATKRGDKGKTSLLSGERVLKSDPQVEAYGVVDELNSWLGLIRIKCPYEDMKSVICHIQKDLFILSAELASRQKEYKKKITEEDVDYIDQNLECYQYDFDLHGFTIPGQSELGSYLDISRTICRRAERRMASAELVEGVQYSECVHSYVNRLSDLLYMLSRTADRRNLIEVVTEKVCNILESEEF